MEQFKPGIYIARDPKKVKYGGEDGGSWLSKYSFVEPEDFEKVASKLKSGKTGDRPIYTRLKTYHKDIWNSIQKNFGIKEEEFSLSDIIEIQEEVVIEHDDKKIILEKGDRIEVLTEDTIYSIPESRNDRSMLGVDELDILDSIQGNLSYYANLSSEKIIKEGISTIKNILDKVDSRKKSDNIFIRVALKEYIRNLVRELEDY